MGPNGAGKTTIFYMMVGLVRPDAGNVLLNGEDITRLPMHRRARMGLGYLPQEPSVFRKLTVRENILAFLEETSLSEGEREDRLRELLVEMRISHVEGTRGYSLSGRGGRGGGRGRSLGRARLHPNCAGAGPRGGMFAPPPPRPPVHRQTGDLLPVEKDMAGIRPAQPHHHIEDGGLSRPVRAQKTDDLPRGDPERDPLDRLPVTISFPQVADSQGPQRLSFSLVSSKPCGWMTARTRPPSPPVTTDRFSRK